MLSIFIAFLLNITLARILGPKNYGVYTLAFTVITLLALPAKAGIPTLVVRETANAKEAKNWHRLLAIWQRAVRYAISISLTVTTTTATILWIFPSWLSDTRRDALFVALPLIPILALSTIRGAQLKGLHNTLIGQIPETIARPFTLLALSIIFILYLPDRDWSASNFLFFHLISGIIAFSLGTFLIHIKKPSTLSSPFLTIHQKKEWRTQLYPLLALATFQLLNTKLDIIMLGILGDDSQVGFYQSAITISNLTIFGLQAINQVVQPKVAGLYTAQHHKQLQKLITLTSSLSTAFAVPPLLIVSIYGDQLLSLLFGAQYSSAATALLILTAGQFFNAAMGPTVLLLNMTNNGWHAAKGVGISTACNLSLNLALIPLFGIEGAAMSTAFSLIIWNATLRHAIKKTLAIETIPIILSSPKNISKT